MTYRGDLEAAQARIHQLEQELDEARAAIARLEEAQKQKKRARVNLAAPRPRSPRRLGKLCYTPPGTYVPLLRLLVRAPGAIWRRRPYLPPPKSNSLLRVAGHALFKLLFHALYLPLYFAVLGLVVLPWACVFAVAVTPVLLPFILLSRITVGPGPAATPNTWFHGNTTDEAAAGFLFAITAPFPAFYPFTMPLMFQE